MPLADGFYEQQLKIIHALQETKQMVIIIFYLFPPIFSEESECPSRRTGLTNRTDVFHYRKCAAIVPLDRTVSPDRILGKMVELLAPHLGFRPVEVTSTLMLMQKF